MDALLSNSCTSNPYTGRRCYNRHHPARDGWWFIQVSRCRRWRSQLRYSQFVIRNYRAIRGPIEIKVEGGSLTPIVGVNESGKTTILHAICAFDYYNDKLNDGGRHLKDTANLYRTSSPPAVIEAVIELSRAELNEAISTCEVKYPTLKPELGTLKKKRALPTTVSIRRELKTLTYSWDSDRFGLPPVQNALARAIIGQLPYILFFDDFRDKVDEQIEIVRGESGSAEGWLSIIEELFRQTDETFSPFALPELEERQRRTVLAKVQRRLNDTLTKEWQTFRLDDRDALKISIDYYQERTLSSAPAQNPAAPTMRTAAQSASAATIRAPESAIKSTTRNYIRLNVVETDSAGDEHFFFISDRSKGFYWFFNFVMKLEFNPKFVTDTEHTIYLLDEPGSYLHAFAQQKLCHKLRQLSDRHRVIYCTHSHYLLDPETIPINSIVVADKDGNGAVSLVPITSYKGAASEKRSALQPVLDALQIKPFALDLISKRTTVIAEGIYDYFALELFRNDRSISVLPSVGADSIKFYISLMIAWQVDFRALWDNDDEGKKRYAQAAQLFGVHVAERNLRLLPMPPGATKRIMQNLFEGTDLVKIRNELSVQFDCSFERTLHALFYSPRRAELTQMVSQRTKQNFEQLFDSLSLA